MSQSCLEKGLVGELKRSAVKLSYDSAWMAILGSKNMKGKSDLVVGMEKLVGGLRRFNQSLVIGILCKSVNLAQVTHFTASRASFMRACSFRGEVNSKQHLCTFLKPNQVQDLDISAALGIRSGRQSSHGGNASAANRLEKIRFLLTESQLLDCCDVICAQDKVYKQRRHPGWLLGRSQHGPEGVASVTATQPDPFLWGGLGRLVPHTALSLS